MAPSDAAAAGTVLAVINLFFTVLLGLLLYAAHDELASLRRRLSAHTDEEFRRLRGPDPNSDRIDDAFSRIDTLVGRADSLANQGSAHGIRLDRLEARAESLSVLLAAVDRRLSLLAGADKAQALARAEFFRSAGAGGRSG